MLKKVGLVLLILSLGAMLAGCGGSAEKENDLTLDDFIKAYTDHGVEVDPNEKQQYSVIGAVDGFIFYIDNSPVKIYEYKTAKDLKNAISEDDMLSEWPSNDRFLLETKNSEAIEIFNNVK